MNDSYEQADFESAIRDKDYIKIKNYVINLIRNNPEFRKKGTKSCEAKVVFKRLLELKNDLPGLFSPYELQAGETEYNEKNQESWNREYFIRQTFLLEENFCKERFEHVTRIGIYLAKEKRNFTQPQEGENNNQDIAFAKTELIENAGALKSSKKPWPIIVVGIIIIVVILVSIMAKKI